MPRDYKRHKPDRRKKNRRKSDNPQAPNWAWLLVGLGLGLMVAWFVNVGKQPEPEQAVVAKTTPEKATKADPAEPTVEQPDQRFDFYDVLPEFEVVIPEQESDVRRDIPGESVTDAGRYILQTGSFQNFADADRMKARLALLGIESRIERVSIDSKTWHRVRIGPIDDLSRVNEFRRRLWDDKIQFIVVRSPNP